MPNWKSYGIVTHDKTLAMKNIASEESCRTPKQWVNRVKVQGAHIHTRKFQKYETQAKVFLHICAIYSES